MLKLVFCESLLIHYSLMAPDSVEQLCRKLVPPEIWVEPIRSLKCDNVNRYSSFFGHYHGCLKVTQLPQAKHFLHNFLKLFIFKS